MISVNHFYRSLTCDATLGRVAAESGGVLPECEFIIICVCQQIMDIHVATVAVGKNVHHD